MGIYDPLATYLKTVSVDQIRIGFAEIEQIICRKLPDSAAVHRGWWSNNASNNVMTRAWLEAGFQSEQVDLAGRTLVFRRVEKDRQMSGFKEAQTSLIEQGSTGADKLSVFGWLSGTVLIGPGVDLCEPADPDWADTAEGA